MRHALDAKQCQDFDLSSQREWLLTNGIGGFATGTACGANMRRFHGHLVAATQPPGEQVMLLSAIEAFAEVAGKHYGVSTNQYAGKVHPKGYERLEAFSVNDHAEWLFAVGRQRLRKRLGMHPGKNAITIEYTNLGDIPMRLELRPLVAHKKPNANFASSTTYPESIRIRSDQFQIDHGGVSLLLTHKGATSTPSHGWYYRLEFPRETERGRMAHDDLFCPVELFYTLGPGESAVLVASDGEKLEPLEFSDADISEETGLEPMLLEAAGKFVVQTDQGPDIVVGYPGTQTSGRQTMIAVPGVLVATGHFEEAKTVLRRWAGEMKKGLLPNHFGETDAERFDSVDVSLWFVNAIYELLVADWDEEFASEALTWIERIVTNHRKGTRHGIRIDPDDGLLTQGETGFQLTWMDVRLRDWRVTPRHGKPVEVNGLWVNALRIASWLTVKCGHAERRYTELGDQAAESMNKKFWHESLGYYLDTVEPDDASLRPNQVIAMGLPFSPLGGEQAGRALNAVNRHLLTSVGIRTLAPDSPGYRGRYLAPMDEPDGALHQGCAWPWLLSFYVSALKKIEGEDAHARRLLENCQAWLENYGMAGIAQFYDGDDPFRAGGSPWHAWSAGEVLRAWYMVDSRIGLFAPNSGTKQVHPK